MKKVIVTTTVQHPTEAIEKFDSLPDWTLVVAGDMKTPADFKLKNGIYLSPADQEKRHKLLSEAIGWNDHARRNFGNLIAADMGADIVAIVDDDNIPYDGWGRDLLIGRETEVFFYEPDAAAFDPIGATNYRELWHRGFPPQMVKARDYTNVARKKVAADIQADFWDGDPDVDAICRMLHAPECKFEPSHFPLASSKPAPFNSQNTFVSKDVLRHYFVLPHVSPRGRSGDIWIAYHVQTLGYRVVFSRPSVYQARNEHDLTVDMVDEYIGYENNHRIVEAIRSGTYSMERFWPEKTRQCYDIYRRCF